MKLKISSLLTIAILLASVQIGGSYFLEDKPVKQQKLADKYAVEINSTTQHKMPDIWVDYQENLHAKKVEADIRHKKIMKFDEILQTSDDSNERIFATSQLAQIGGKEALTVIEKGLGDSDISVRSHVIKALSAMDGENTAHLLGQVLFSKDEQDLKLQVLEALSDKVSSAGLSLVQYIATHEADPVVQNKAMDILAYHKGNTELPPDTEGEEDFYGIMQRAAYLPSKKAVTSLQYILQESPDANLREEALAAVANSNESNAIAIIENTLLSDNSSAVRYQAINALKNRNSETLPTLGRVLFGDPDPELRIEAINVLALEDAPANLAFLRQALNDPDEHVRNTAKQYLSNK